MKKLDIKVLLVTDEDFTDEWGIRFKIEFLKDQSLIDKADLIIYQNRNSMKCERILKDKYGIL